MLPAAPDFECFSANDADIAAVRSLWREYWDSVNLPPDFQGFDEELGTLPGVYAPPAGRLLLATWDGEPAGTAAFRLLSASACEAKRLYVRPLYRGKGVGGDLVRKLVEEARGDGNRRQSGGADGAADG
jgi:putative acetyltransferase